MGVPVLFLIDRNGTIRARFEGENNLDKIEQSIKALLASPSVASPRK
jgi:glutathione peroxidase-family protein